MTSLSLAYSPVLTFAFTTSAMSFGRVMLSCRVVRMAANSRFDRTKSYHSKPDNSIYGALRAAKWLAGKDRGLFDMRDVLSLR